MLSLPDGAKTIGKVLVKTGLLLHSRDASLGLWKGLILLSIDPAQHSYLVAILAGFWCLFLSEICGAKSRCCGGLVCLTSTAPYPAPPHVQHRKWSNHPAPPQAVATQLVI